jgi:sigma-B regulation protein RsbU (phosphoserine phosphatase)
MPQIPSQTVPSEVESLQKSLRIYRGLVEVSGLINSITDFDELLRAILAVARRVMQAEASSLFLTDDASGGLNLVMSSRADDEFVHPQILVPRGQGISGWVLEQEKSLLIPDAYADSRFFRDADKKSGFRTRSILCSPLQQDGAVIGVIQVLNPTDSDAFDEQDLEAFEAYSSLIATAIDKLRFIERMREQERVQRDVQIASEIQQELLSRAVPESLPGYEFASHYKPAQNVGGDFFLVFPREDDSVFFAIGDVSGKGISASLLMAQTLSAMQFVFATTESPADALALLNRNAETQLVRGMFVTLLVGRMKKDSGTLLLSSAGHCRPWILRKNGTCEEIQTAGALPIGIMPGIAYAQIETPFELGDLWVSFTDGLTESRSPHTGGFFEEKLNEILSTEAPDATAVIRRLVQAEEEFRDGDDPRDDLTLLAGGFR